MATTENQMRMGGTNFLVTIHRQDNHSWQGVIEWLDTGKKIHFRSAIEMLALMEQAVPKALDARSWEEDKSIKAI